MTTKPSYTPARRFPDFLNDGEWKVKRLGEIAELTAGATPSTTRIEYWENGSIPWMSSGEVHNGQIFDTEKRITQIGYDNCSTKLVPANSVVVALAGQGKTRGTVAITRIELCTNQSLCSILPNKSFNSDFLYFYLNSKYEVLRQISSGDGTRGGLNLQMLRDFPIPLPPLSEQRRIAQALTALDELIAATNEKLEQMKAYKKGLMQQLFVDSMGGGKSLKINYLQIPKLRFPEFYEEKEWIYYNGDKMFEPIVNKNHNSDLPVLAITQDQGAIPRDLIDYNVIVSDKSIEAYKVVEIGDFIISLRSFQGGIEYSKFKGLCSPAYIVLRKKSDDVCDDFYRYYFKSNQYIQDLNRNLEGIRDGKMVSYKQFSDIMIPCPKYEEQRKIASCLSAMDETINAYTEKVGLLGQYKKGLMQQMFPQNQMN